MIKISINFYGSSSSIYWENKWNLHRIDGPAIVYPNGTQEWYKEGLHHRDDGPAVIHPDGNQIWYKEGVVIKRGISFPDGTQYWYKDPNKKHIH